MSVNTESVVARPQVDVRGPRFVAWVTTAVLIVALLVSTASVPVAAVILGLQTVVFAVGAALGPRRHPYGTVFAALIAPRLGPVTEREPVAPLKFAQLVGFVFAGVGTAGFAL
ncbi:MAG: rane protein, partial [Mycobacterium sp.]|nr:rane protein [Mycobacterium sp.]